MKPLFKALIMVVIAIGVGVGVAYAAYSIYDGFRATLVPSTEPDGSQTYAELNKKGLYFSNDGDTANRMKFFDGNDVINMGSGDDALNLSTGKDAICFGGDNYPGVITFDTAGAGIGLVDYSNEYIRSDSPDSSSSSQIKIRSHNVILSTHGGDVIIELGMQ